MGGYCHSCGQKDISDQDRRFSHLLELFATELVSLDGKFWRTLRAMFTPGFLARAYLDGRRAPYLSPVSIFLLVNALYFLFPVLTDFDLPFKDQVPGQIAVQLESLKDATPERRQRVSSLPGQLHSRWSAAWVNARIAYEQANEPKFSIDDLAMRFDAKSGDISQLLIVLHVPFLALALMVMFWRSKLYFAEHFVVAMVLFASILFAVQLIFPLASLFSVPEYLTAALRWALALGFGAMISNALRRIYDVPVWHSALAAFGFLVALVLINISVYRSLQFVIVFALC